MSFEEEKKGNTRELIEAVRRFPCVYHKKDKKYKDKVARAAAWIEIAAESGYPGIFLVPKMPEYLIYIKMKSQLWPDGDQCATTTFV